MPSLMLRGLKPALIDEIKKYARAYNMSTVRAAEYLMEMGMLHLTQQTGCAVGEPRRHVYRLSLEAVTFAGKGPTFPGEIPVTYRALGMPAGCEARVNRADDSQWRALTWLRDGDTIDLGAFESPDSALAAIQAYVDRQPV